MLNVLNQKIIIIRNYLCLKNKIILAIIDHKVKKKKEQIMEKIVLPIELYSSKNSRQIFRTKSGRTIIAKSNASKQNERDLCFLLNIYRKEWERLTTGKKYPLKVHLFIYRKTKRRFDYVNLSQNLFDCMQMAEWLPDDDADHLIPVFDGYSVDKDNPRVEISVE